MIFRTVLIDVPQFIPVRFTVTSDAAINDICARWIHCDGMKREIYAQPKDTDSQGPWGRISKLHSHTAFVIIVTTETRLAIGGLTGDLNLGPHENGRVLSLFMNI